MFQPRPLDDHTSVAPQIALDDLPAIRAAGFATLINNRPDDEEPGQPHGDAVRAAAEAAGLRYVAIPVGRDPLTRDTVTAMADALDHGPALAFCRSGTRSCNLWAMARAARGDDPDMLADRAAAAGYDLTALRPVLAGLAPRG